MTARRLIERCWNVGRRGIVVVVDGAAWWTLAWCRRSGRTKGNAGTLSIRRRLKDSGVNLPTTLQAD